MKKYLNRPSWLGLRWLVGLLAFCFSAAAAAANPPDWWIDIANDRASNVQAELARGADPNELSPKGNPALMQAIRDGAWKVYDVLLADRRTILNAINTHKETALMYLAVIGDTQRAQDLIRRGALVNRLGWTPLQYAASKGHLDTVKMLISQGAMVNAPAPDGTTALMMAAFSGSEEVVQYLLDQGADVTTQNLQQLDAADWARSNNKTSLADKLDQLTKRVLAQRAQRRGTAQGAAAGGPVVTHEDASHQGGAWLNGQTPDGSASEGRQNQGAEAPPTRSTQDREPARTDSSTSKYFDLDRFNTAPSN
ncbi:ankyrin repeat domain-containing protein [Allopusillimonas soli]|uniref:Ankyrin repeat domain-containing protein n=1 Tax=Allopusillimonas soli TaxID=659016 RepID=A0A853FDX7_9BURK|nr:ankyrin repeat domain-containing protein [Allopusillimonas soli]NYT36711.1 ankyrin repeat domain-containing protein [Allopusillimonas soli]TEA75188.1 ankyrin repeat domain-containing protein [Allopusillimonas soli]